MGLLDLITGGENETAQSDLSQALQNVEAVQTPTSEQLQLSPLAQYENTGNLGHRAIHCRPDRTIGVQQ